MPISPERLAAHADQFHAVAEQQLRKHHAATTFLVFVPETGEPTLMALPTGQLPATARAIEIARQTRARALILTGEVWTAASTLASEKRRPRTSRSRTSRPPASRPNAARRS